MSSTQSVPAQRIPAWKKLGLKLKQPVGGPAAAEPANGSSVVGQPGGSTGHKRKIEAPPTTTGSPLKKTRRDEQHVFRNGSSSSLKSKKSVTFGDTPSKNDPVPPATTPTTARNKTTTTNTNGKAKTNQAKEVTSSSLAKPKKPKGPTKKQTAPSNDINPALEYLRQWKTSRESWKFNKNHQSALIKHIFEPNAIPASDIDAFYEYVRDLKGFVRKRLREMAMEVQMHDVEAGTAGFPDDTMDIDDKQEVYDAILADILRRKRQQQNSPKRKFFSESQFVADSDDPDVVIRRVVKRMRAELVLDELSDEGESTDTTSTSMSSKTVTASDNNTTMTTDGEKQQANAKEGVSRRRRKLRVNMEDSSSSESDSDSGSGDDSSSSSSEDSDSEDEADVRPDNSYDTSSSSSSSSSDDGDSEDDDSDDDDNDNETGANGGASRT
jgi:hypothetical protein